MTTWYEVEETVQEWAVQDFLAGQYDEENVDQWAHETADGCEYTIYYHHQNALWADSAYVQSFEDMAYGVDDIQDKIQACVYYAIYETALAAGQSAVENIGVPHTVTRTKGFTASTGDWVVIPVLDTKLAAPTR